MEETQISAYQDDRSRHKRLDAHRDFLIHQLKRFPKLSAVKLARRLQERRGELGVSSRSIRRYVQRSEEHTSELQSLMRISYAVFCLKKKKKIKQHNKN